MANDFPIYFVHGILGWGPEEDGFGRYWGEARRLARESLLDNPVRFASVGPVSSHWDRARELFYQIYGQDVDYGEEHSSEHGHDRRIDNWPKKNLAPHPGWSEDNPVHFIGHSQGPPTIRLLEWMLENQLFEDENGRVIPTNHRWITSVTSISGVLNGATMPYAAFDASPETGRLEGGVVWSTLRQVPGAVINGVTQPGPLWHVLKAIPEIKTGYNWDLEHWGLERKDLFIMKEPVLTFLPRLLLHPFFKGTDNAPYSLSVHGTVEMNRYLETYDDTYYFSYVTQSSRRTSPWGHHVPDDHMHFFLKDYSHEIGKYDKELVDGFYPEQWWANDGAVSAISQTYPFLPHEQKHEFVYESFFPEKREPGQWYVMRRELEGWDHTDPVMFPDSGERRDRQYNFYARLLTELAGL